MDIMVIEKNKTSNLIGLIFVSAVNCLNTSFTGANWNAKMMIAPNRAITQYVLILIFPILILGRTSRDTAMSMNVITEIIIVAIIVQPLLSTFIYKSGNTFLY